MKRIGLYFLVCLLGITLLSSCGETPPAVSDFAYADSAFTAALRGTYIPADGIPRPVAAEVTAGPPPAGGGERDLTITFSEPPSLAGVTVRRMTPSREGPPTVTFTADSAHGRVTATATHGEYDGLLRFAEALIPQGDVAEISPVGGDGTHTVTRRNAEGDFEAVYLLGESGGLPLRVTVRTPKETLELAVSPARDP